MTAQLALPLRAPPKRRIRRGDYVTAIERYGDTPWKRVHRGYVLDILPGTGTAVLLDPPGRWCFDAVVIFRRPRV